MSCDKTIMTLKGDLKELSEKMINDKVESDRTIYRLQLEKDILRMELEAYKAVGGQILQWHV